MSCAKRYLDRERAGPCGTVAQQHDGFRPPYPMELIDRLVESKSPDVSNMWWCGAGQTAAALSGRRASALDERMTVVTPRNGIDVEAFEHVHREYAPGTNVDGRLPKGDGSTADPWEGDDAFRVLENAASQWSLTLTADQRTGLVKTFSVYRHDHRQRGPERLAALPMGLHAAIGYLGGTVRAKSGAFPKLPHRV